MHYELQLKYYNSNFPDKTKWDPIQFFPEGDQGKTDAVDAYEHMSSVDKRRSYRLVSVTKTIEVLRS